MKFSHAALLACAVLIAAPGYAANDTADIAKESRGVLRGDVPVVLTITKAQTGGNAGTVKWGEPYRCASQLNFITQQADTWTFSLSKGNGPFCKSVDGGKVFVKKAKTNLQFRLTAPMTGAPLQETIMN